MQTAGVDTYEDYRSYLEAEPREFAELLDTILINVTGFFRDPAAWEYLAKEIVPKIVEHKPVGERIRAWSAGCATGEEAYTIAMLFAEALGAEAYAKRVKIYATDLDDDALATARLARYDAKATDGVPENLRAEYFEDGNSGSTVRSDIRRSVVFGRNDLLSDPPISKVDLLVSRNTLMYFGTQAQHTRAREFFLRARARRLPLPRQGRGAPQPDEPLSTHRPEAPGLHEESRHRAGVRGTELSPAPPLPEEKPRLRESSFESGPSAQLVIDTDGRVALANTEARDLSTFRRRMSAVRCRISRSRIGRSSSGLGSTRRSASARRSSSATSSSGSTERIIISTPVQPPAVDGRRAVRGEHRVRRRRARPGLRNELEAAKRGARERLRGAAVDGRGARDDERGAPVTNEELETTNEELQSTNEELETMNEELQSTNEELQTINDELRDERRVEPRERFPPSVLRQHPEAVVVLDRDCVTGVEQRGGGIWGVSAHEARGPVPQPRHRAAGRRAA